MDEMLYPPGTDAAAFRKVPRAMLEDAVQEAWVASLDDRDPVAAADAYCKREQKVARRMQTGGGMAEHIIDRQRRRVHSPLKWPHKGADHG